MAPISSSVFVRKVISSSIVLDCMSRLYSPTFGADAIHKGTAQRTRFASFSSLLSSLHHSSTPPSPFTHPLNLAFLPTFPPRFSTPSLPSTLSQATTPSTTFAISGPYTTASTSAKTLSSALDVASSRRCALNACSFTVLLPQIPRH